MLLQAPVFERKSVVDQSASKRKEAVPKNKMAPNLLLLSYYSLEHDFISLSYFTAQIINLLNSRHSYFGVFFHLLIGHTSRSE